jgi:hypothetical protein
MKKNTVELIITVILIVILLVAVSHMLRARKQFIGQKKRATMTSAQSIQPRVYAIVGSGIPEDIEEHAQNMTWGRDPFVYQSSYTEGASVDLKLEGIVWDRENPKAMISGVIIGIGEHIGNYTILEIKPNSVLITDGTDDIILRL